MSERLEDHGKDSVMSFVFDNEGNEFVMRQTDRPILASSHEAVDSLPDNDSVFHGSILQMDGEEPSESVTFSRGRDAISPGGNSGEAARPAPSDGRTDLKSVVREYIYGSQKSAKKALVDFDPDEKELRVLTVFANKIFFASSQMKFKRRIKAAGNSFAKLRQVLIELFPFKRHQRQNISMRSAFTKILEGIGKCQKRGQGLQSQNFSLRKSMETLKELEVDVEFTERLRNNRKLFEFIMEKSKEKFERKFDDWVKAIVDTPDSKVFKDKLPIRMGLFPDECKASFEIFYDKLAVK